MFLKVALFAMIAASIAGLGVIGWVVMHPAAPSPAHNTAVAPAPATVSILAASRLLPVGTLLAGADLASRQVPSAGLPAGAELDDRMTRARLVGAAVQHELNPGQTVTAQDLALPGEHGPLASLLSNGMRAVTLGVDVITSAAGLIAPGDHVDVVLTQTHAEPTTVPARKVSAEIVGRDLRVVAVDKQLLQGAAATGGGAPTPRTVTLETSEQDARRLAVAAELGKLDLVVRAPEPPGLKTATLADAAFGQAPGGSAPSISATIGQGTSGQVTWSSDTSRALDPAGPTTTNSVRVSDPAGDKEYPF